MSAAICQRVRVNFGSISIISDDERHNALEITIQARPDPTSFGRIAHLAEKPIRPKMRSVEPRLHALSHT
jgi:hypothetical protein